MSNNTNNTDYHQITKNHERNFPPKYWNFWERNVNQEEEKIGEELTAQFLTGEMYWIQLHIKFSHSSLVLSGVLQDITEILLKMASNTHVYIWWKQWTHYYNSKVTIFFSYILMLHAEWKSSLINFTEH